jgi:hypothetical protein
VAHSRNSGTAVKETMYRITEGCPCDPCGYSDGCESECFKFRMWVAGRRVYNPRKSNKAAENA